MKKKLTDGRAFVFGVSHVPPPGYLGLYNRLIGDSQLPVGVNVSASRCLMSPNVRLDWLQPSCDPRKIIGIDDGWTDGWMRGL